SKSIINFKSDINIAKKFSENLSETIYRIIQEGIENCIKHSNATIVEIKLNTMSNKLNLSIIDNGKGINKEDLNKKGSFGLIGIEERLIPHNGVMSFTSTDPGCSLNIEVPL
ncbi:MAG: two-component sensor histidine kinase, partial [Rickettsiales bacterium]|nr:two-component sensor histidine kinase [Rickettsiales bacterium]